MPHFDIRSKEDREKLQQLINMNKQLKEESKHKRILKQTNDEELAELYAPLTKKIDESAQAITGLVNAASEKQATKLSAIESAVERATAVATAAAVGSAPAILPKPSTGRAKPLVITIDTSVLKMLSKAQTVTNPKFRITPIDGNRFMFHETEILLEGKVMKFPDGYEVELTPNILDALTNKDNDLKGLTSAEQSDFINILRATNSLQSGDRRSKRGKALDKMNELLFTPLRAAQWASPMMRESPIATLQSNITPSPSFREEVDSDDDDVYNSFDERRQRSRCWCSFCPRQWFHQTIFII